MRLLVTLVAAITILLLAAPPTIRYASAASALIAADVIPGTPGIQSSRELTIGGDVPIDLAIQAPNGVGAFEVEVVYDSSALAFVSWVTGPFLGSTGRATACVPTILQHSVHLACSTMGATPAGASGDGVLATLVFHPIYPTTTCLLLTVAQLADVGGTSLSTEGQDGCLTVLPADADADGIADDVDNCPLVANVNQTNTDAGNPANHLPGADGLGDLCDDDIDGDGYTNAQEQALGRDPRTYCFIMRADLDNDGRVSVLDLTKIAQMFSKSVPPAPDRYRQHSEFFIGVLDLTNVATVFSRSVSECP